MSIERKDIRAHLDHDMHTKLKVLCDVDGVDMGVFIEQVLIPVIEKRTHAAMLIADELRRHGITGNLRDSTGVSGR